MAMKSRPFVLLIVLSMMLLLLTGCGRAFGSYEPIVEAIDDNVVVQPIRYLENLEEGPLYQFTITVPDEWVGQIATRNNGNVVQFDYVDPRGYQSLLFSIEALSESQYWEQIGSYPGQYTNIVNTDDTYFIYNLPIDPFYSNLTTEEFEVWAAMVPPVIATFEVEPLQ
jgi:hypothetical protein